MCRSIFSNQTTTVDAEYHFEVLNSYIMNYLVVCPLHKSRVDVAEWYHPLCGETCRKCDGMLFSNSDIECAVWHFLNHQVHGAPCGHSRRYSYNFLILFGQFYKGFSKYILKFCCLSGFTFSCINFTCNFVEQSWCMIFSLIHFCQGKTFAFFGNNMQQFWTGDILQVGQYFSQILYIMTVNGAEVPEVECFKQVILFQKEVFECMLVFLYEFSGAFSKTIQFSQSFPNFLFYLIIGMRFGYIHQVLTNYATVWVDGHIVVIENYQEVYLTCAGII